MNLRLILGVVVLLAASARAQAAPDPRDLYSQMADEVAAKVTTNAVFQAKTDGGRKVRIVIGDVVNNSDDEGVRVEDLFNEIRNQIVSAGTTRLFAPGELNVDFIISPEFTSSFRPDEHGRRRRCFTLNLTLTKPSGEFALAQSALRCS